MEAEITLESGEKFIIKVPNKITKADMVKISKIIDSLSPESNVGGDPK